MAQQPHQTATPKYRRQKRPHGTDDAFVVLSDVRHYLGTLGSSESKQAYHALIAEWESNRQSLPVPCDELTITELVARYWVFAQEYYRKPDGTTSPEVAHLRRGLRPVAMLYGDARAGDFGPRALKAVRQWMVKRRQARRDINRQVGRIRRMFKWAVGEELLRPDVLQALQAVDGLKRGRCAAKETEAIKPVPDAFVDAVRPHVARQVWAIIELQRLTTARAGELVVLRSVDLDTTGRVWLYRPSDHKNAYRDHDRVIYIGPRAQAVLRPFLADRAVDAYLFSPREAVAEIKAANATTRRRPDQPPNPRKTDRKVRERYDVGSYRRAIARACKVAGGPPWHPHRLRHNAATALRKEFGIEGAQMLLGHKHADVTQIYAETNHDKALAIAQRVG